MVVIIFLAAKLLIILIHPIWKNKNMKLCFIQTSLSETKFYLWRKNMEMFLWQYCLCFQTVFYFYFENEKKSSFFLSFFLYSNWPVYHEDCDGQVIKHGTIQSRLTCIFLFPMSWSVSHSRRSLISCQSPGLEINFHCCLHVSLQPFCEHTSRKWLSGAKSQNVFFFLPHTPLHFFSLRWICSLIFFLLKPDSFSCQNPPERDNPGHPAEEAETASDRKKFHLKCNFIMLIYHPNLNLNCGRLCSIVFPSPAFKDCQLFL